MAGHSKWANIKHRKAAQDAKKGKAFTRLSKEITVAAKEGGDPGFNPRLRTLIEKARQVNMPVDNITRAIKKGTGELPGAQYEAHSYEGYGPHGIAVIVETLTENKNRAVAEVRHAFNKGGGSMGDAGSVAWMFERAGVIKLVKTGQTEDELLELLLDHDIKDIRESDDLWIITCAPTETDAVRKTLEDKKYKIEHAELEWVPKESIELEDDQMDKAVDFLESLEALDDVQNVYTNLG